MNQEPVESSGATVTSSITPTAPHVALVAGASRGLGLLIAAELARRGYRVVGCARDQGELDAARAFCQEQGLDLDVRVCDVSDATAVRTLVDQVENELGPIAVAIHVAGIIQVGPLAALTREHFEQAIDVMLWGPINVCLAVLPSMTSRGTGRIGVVTSVGGGISVPHLLPYSTAKFAAVGFTEGLRAELSGSGVTATTVMPGLMRTGSHLNAQFTGDHTAEYAWFAPGASLPLLSMDAERAAARIVRGVLSGSPHVVLTPLAKLGLRVHGLAPSTTVRMLGLVSRALPGATPGGGNSVGTGFDETGAEAGTITGHQARARLNSPLVERLTRLGTAAARRYNAHRSSR